MPVVFSALWLGILTSISPCPLATNIVAVSFISRGMANPWKVFFSSLFYTFGRSLAYMGIAVVIISSLFSLPSLSHFLEKYINVALGPLLILTGMVLLNLLTLPGHGITFQDRIGRRFQTTGPWGALLLGSLFALSFCPVSAALFFGSLIPVAFAQKSAITLPAIYGIGTGLPVFAFSVFIAIGTKNMAAAYNKIGAFESWARRVTGILFIGVGVYYCLIYIFEFS